MGARSPRRAFWGRFDRRRVGAELLQRMVASGAYDGKTRVLPPQTCEPPLRSASGAASWKIAAAAGV